MLALLGPNGAGKTTTVRILSTLLKADDGSVTIEGHDVVSDAGGVRSVIGLTGQSAAVDELLTGRENLVMMGRLYRLTKASAVERSIELLEEFDLVDAADRKTSTYSGGMRRRLDLAVSLIATPPIIFLDEPTTGLDPRSRLVMWDIIKNLMQQGTTILLTTQYLEEADQLADKIILINDGRVAAEGTAKELKAKIGNDRLMLSFDTANHLAKASSLLGHYDPAEDSENLQLSLGIKSNGSDVRAILDKLEKSKISVVSMDIHKPTLDDVFLSLTEREVE
jgi:ABC-2 type transport system ATP-binding protein